MKCIIRLNFLFCVIVITNVLLFAYRRSVVVRGPSPVTLSSPSVIDMQFVSEKEVEEESGPCPLSPSVSLSVQRGSTSVEPSSISASSFGSIARLSTDTLIAVSPQFRFVFLKFYILIKISLSKIKII